MSLATLSIDVEARLARLEEGLDKAARINATQAKRVEDAWGKAGAAAGGAMAALAAAVSVASIGNWAKANLAAVDSLNDIKDATGASIEGISALQDLARRTGTDISVVDDALVKLNMSLNAAKPGSDQADALKRIGLNAQELRKIDPAEALRQVAVALSKAADDGDRARLVQELLGRSARELAPLLKDLGEAGQLNATVTTEQAENAEKLVKEMAKLNAWYVETSQSILLRMVPATNTLIERWQRMGGLSGLFGSIGKEFSANFTSDRLSVVVAEIESLQKTFDRQGADSYLLKKMAGLRAEAAALSKDATSAADALKRFANTTDPAAAAKAGGSPPAKPSVKPPSGNGKTGGGARESDLESYIRRLEQETLGAADLSRAEQIDMAIDSGVFKGGASARVQYLRELAAGLDKLKEKADEMTVDIPQDEIDKLKRVQDLVRSTPGAQVRAITEDLAALDAALGRGAVGITDYDQVKFGLEERLRSITDMKDEVSQATDQMSEFAKEAQRNIQDALGSSLKAALKGDFDSIGGLWMNLLLDMSTQALAARLNDKLFGQGGGGASLLGSLFGWMGLANGGAFSKGLQFYAQGDVFGRPTMFAHAGGLGVLGEAGEEAVMPLKRGRGGKLGVVAQGGGSTVIHQTIQVSGDVSASQVRAIKESAQAGTLQALAERQRRGGGTY